MTDATTPSPAEEPATDADAQMAAVRADIEATRADLAHTVDALSAKLDVKARAGDKVGEVKQRAAETAPPRAVQGQSIRKAALQAHRLRA